MLENSTACQKSMPITSSRGWLGHCLVVGSGFGRIILWLKLDDQLFLSWLFGLQSGFRALHGFKVCSGRFSRLGCLNINGEFDPGSGRTLAACLTHASRTVMIKLAWSDQWRTGE